MATHSFGPLDVGQRVMVLSPQRSLWDTQRGRITRIYTDPLTGNRTLYVLFAVNGFAVPFGEGELARS